MNTLISANSPEQKVVTVAALFIIIAGLKASAPLLVPSLLSIFIAVISAPPMFWLERKGLPTLVALVIVILAIIVILITVAALVGSSVDSFSANIPQYEGRLRTMISTSINWLDSKGVSVAPDREFLFKYMDPGKAMNLAASLLNSLGSVLTNSFLIFITVIFILLEASGLPAKMAIILREPGKTLPRFQEIGKTINNYLMIKSLTSLITGFLIAVCLHVLGVDYPVLWGTLAFMLNFIPNIGSIIAAVPAVLLALVQLGPATALWTVAVYVAVNSLIGNLVEPKFMGRELGLSTLVVFLSLVFWGWVMGPVGMFLSVPLTITIKIALDASEETRWLAVLLGPEVEPKDPGPLASGTLHEEASEHVDGRSA
ncbi:MAG: AI-2E family transporter [Gammaproteobacteria bacterium]|nr:AI-2E family transporter [Gammaproteobacteria bacterium]